MAFNRVQLLKAFMGHWEVLAALGDGAEKLADPATNTMVKRWQVIRSVGDKLAPDLDEIIASLQSSVSAQAMSLSATEQELEQELLGGLRHAYAQAMAEQAVGKLILAAGATEDEKKAHEKKKAEVSFNALADATERAKRFDGRWLNAALQLAQIVLPILLPKLIGA